MTRPTPDPAHPNGPRCHAEYIYRPRGAMGAGDGWHVRCDCGWRDPKAHGSMAGATLAYRLCGYTFDLPRPAGRPE